MWYSGAIQKRYAAQRDYEHLKKNYEQLSANLDRLVRDQTEGMYEITLELKEVKGLTNLVLTKLTPTIDTSGWVKQRKED